MAKSGTCELCGLPDNSYSVEDNGNVFKVCKLCYDGFIAKHGSDSIDGAATDDVDALAEQIKATPETGAKPETLSPDQMAKLLTPTSEERRKLNNAMKRAASTSSEEEDEAKEERRKLSESLKRTTAMLTADTEDIRRELLEAKEQIAEEERIVVKQKEKDKAKQAQKSPSETEQDKLDGQLHAQRAEEKRRAAIERMRKAANPTIDDERIKITSPEVELQKDTRPKTNFDVATKEHVSSVRFIQAFKYVVHPAVYAVFAGLVVLAVATALMITMTWKEAVIDFCAGAGAVSVGFLLVWYLKRRLEVDRRTYLLRIRQEQIAFDSMTTTCYRELKTKYPMIKALAWLLSKLSIILTVATIIGGTAAAVILSFLVKWWLLAPVIVGAAIGGVLIYYIFKFAADFVSYKLDIERNQQIMQQTFLDILSKKGK
ncbi:hypothetical protein [Anaerocaecibacter muris]|uniref:tripartite tricarboxylate transporter TctB family protein n=1 Tax=Anaerocaecibacter muris TaxID=2941513 RepID=UPI003F69232C